MIIFILGVTGSGKTTVAQQLAQRLGCGWIEADKFYDHIGKKYNINDFDKFCSPKNWGQLPSIHEERVRWYKDKNYSGETLVIEGATPVYPQALKSILKGLEADIDDCLFIHLEPSNWEELFLKKHGINPNPLFAVKYAKEVANNLKGSKVVKIKDVNYLGSPLVYQRQGFTDEKWKRLQTGDLSGKTILDLGCNSGWFSKYAFQQGAKAYTGVDNQIKEIIYARHLFDGEFIHQDIEDFLDDCIEENRTFDVCIMASTLHYFDNKEEIIEKISKIANRLILEIPISQESEAKEFPKEGKEYTIPSTNLVLEWLKKNFDEHSVVGQSIPPDGSYRLVFNGIMYRGLN